MPEEDLAAALYAAYLVEVERRGRQFVETPELEKQIRQMAHALTTPNQKYGLMLCGQVGNGKTTFIRAVQKILNMCNLRTEGDYPEDYRLVMVDSKVLAKTYADNIDEFNRIAGLIMLAIDDLGQEPVELQMYGNVYRPIVDLLGRRYDKQQFTMITTNLAPNEIGEIYGGRIADRLAEMMNVIVFENSSYRRM